MGLEFIIPSGFEINVVADGELNRTVLFHMSHLPIVDCNYFYGTNQVVLPPITVNEKVSSGEYNFTLIPSDLHYTIILKNLSSLEELLAMRLVCKQWNYFIMNDSNVWKRLICNNMISEDLFRFCDSSFTVEELETILGRGRNQIPLHFSQQVINYFYEKNDWKSLYFTLVRRHLTFIRDLDEMKSREFFDKYFQVSSSIEEYNNSKKKLQIGVTTGLLNYTDLTKNPSSCDDSEIYIPRDAISEFKKLGSNYSLIGVVDFTKFSTFISCRLFPKSGLLYCFGDFTSGQGEFLYFENYSFESDDIIIFETNDDTFTEPEPVNPFQVCNEQVVVNQSNCCPLFYLQQAEGELSGISYLAPSVFFNNTAHEKRGESYQEDNIVLLSATFNVGKTISVFISRDDLILRKFSNAKLDICAIDIYY